MQRQRETFRCRRCLSGMAPFCGALMRGRRRISPTDRDAVPQRAYHTRVGDFVFKKNEAAEHVFAVCEGWAHVRSRPRPNSGSTAAGRLVARRPLGTSGEKPMVHSRYLRAIAGECTPRHRHDPSPYSMCGTRRVRAGLACARPKSTFMDDSASCLCPNQIAACLLSAVSSHPMAQMRWTSTGGSAATPPKFYPAQIPVICRSSNRSNSRS